MEHYRLAVLGLLILQAYVGAAPSNITNAEEIIKKEDSIEVTEPDEPAEVTKLKEPIEINEEEPKLNSQPLPVEESKEDDNAMQNFRQKRFYNFYGYGVPPMNPVVYPSYNKRDQSTETGVYGLVEDPLDQIQRRLQDIAGFVRQPIPPPPPPTHFPFFFPVIYIPQYGCDCNSNNGNTEPPQPENPQTPRPDDKQKNQTTAEERFPILDDVRQNWGFTSNGSDTEYDEEEFSRPISFNPIAPSRPNMRPAPPVDHGSSEGNAVDRQQTTTTVRPRNPTRRPAPPQGRPSNPPQGRPSSPGQPTPYPPSFAPAIPNEQPSTCDGAVLSCCHKAQVTYDCFVAQGCPDPTSYGNPCDSLVILRVIEKFQKYYGVRNGK